MVIIIIIIYFLDFFSVSGEITTTALLDRELKSEYILIVRAVDGGVGPQQKTGIATVTVLQQHSCVSFDLLSAMLIKNLLC